MNNEQLLSRTRALYSQLGGVGFSRGTYEDLGRAINDKLRFDLLPMPVKRSLLLLVRDYHEQLDLIVEAESVTEEAITAVEQEGTAVAADVAKAVANGELTDVPKAVANGERETTVAGTPINPVTYVPATTETPTLPPPPADPDDIAVTGATPSAEMPLKGNEP